MAGPDLIFDGGDLAPAAVDSCGHPLTLFSNLIERAAVAFQYRLLAAQFLPPLHHHVHILRVQLDAVADALGEFRSGQGRPRSEEWLVNGLATLRVIQ